MALELVPPSAAERRRFASIQKLCPVNCRHATALIRSLADYVGVLGGMLGSANTYWFRGHSQAGWSLTPVALRPKSIKGRDVALSLISDFKRIAEAKLPRLPGPRDEYKWAQVAQHYGLPTRLLDWTESATTALYFACLKPAEDAIVFVINPTELNSLGELAQARILDPQTDQKLILRSLKWGAREGKSGGYPLAVHPVWGSERIIAQRGTFTLHGSMFSLDKLEVSSLVAVPIFREHKSRLRSELRRVGVDEMTLFPELEHSCRHLKTCSGLMKFD